MILTFSFNIPGVLYFKFLFLPIALHKQKVNSMHRGLILFLFLFFLCDLSKGQTTAELNRYKDNYILIVNSHSDDDTWENTFAAHLRKRLNQKFPHLAVKIDYVATNKRNSMIASHYAMQGIFLQNRIRPAVLVILGDEGWMSYRKMRLGSWRKVPVVLCHVQKNILKDYAVFFENYCVEKSQLIPVDSSRGEIKVTGIYEESGVKPTLALIQKLFPDTRELVFISGKIYSDEYVLEELRQILACHYPEIKLNVYEDSVVNTDTLAQIFNHFSPHTVLLCKDWHTKWINGQQADPAFAALFGQNFPVPVFTLEEVDALKEAVVGGCFLSQPAYVEEVADYVSRIIQGENVVSLPFRSFGDRKVYLNEKAVLHFGLKPFLPPGDQIVYYNVAPGFFEKYQRGILIGFFCICIGLIVGFIYIRDRSNRKELEAAYEQYKKLYAEFGIVYENMPVGLFLLDADGKLLRKNPVVETWEKNHGFLEKMGDFFHSPLCGEEICQKIKNRIPVDETISWKQKEGMEFYFFRMIIRYIEEKEGNTFRILLMLMDTTAIFKERIKKEKIWNVFEFAMEAAFLGVAEYNLLDSSGFATHSWYRNLSREKRSDFTDIYQNVWKEDREKLLRFIEQVRRGEQDFYFDVVRVLRSDHKISWLRYLIQLIEYAPEKGRIIVAELNLNVDKQKQRELELTEALRKVKESEQLKSAFVANMGHEIRTPLNAITGFADLLVNSTDQEEKQQFAALIEENTATLLRLIGDVIDLSKIEAGTIDFSFTETDLNDLLQSIVAETRLKANLGKVNILFEEKQEYCFMVTDRIRLKQVISNFVSNALKFTLEGEIRIGYRLEAEQLYIYVADTGIGIPKARQSEIFDRFVSLSAHVSGYGLGLSIARSIVCCLKGKIGVDSEEGKGSTFWCSFPLDVAKVTTVSGESKPRISNNANSLAED